ncbi:MAG TPA: ferritin-like domain-containing protein [Verrucomicrobiae bacterium]|jgi:bacterioferritin (cytochrome b1)|nr:ferritin-like domain-containing protein [Verrucomicrobiae bacterium]
MPRYLVLANQTAASPELTSAVREIVAQDADTEFVLLVPATPVEDLLDWQDGDSETIAMRTAQAAKDHLAGAGAKVARTEVGDASPVKAIENELEQHQEKYDGIIISTLPLQRSRWVALDQPRRIERRFKVPVRHVVGHSVTMTREDLINGLNEDLNLELETLLRSVYHAAAGRGMLGHELRELLKKELPGELEHATFLADKIVALGGEVHIRPAMPAEFGAARELLQQNIAAERKIIGNYARRIDQAAEFGDKGLAIRLENMLAAETDHLEQLERLGR